MPSFLNNLFLRGKLRRLESLAREINAEEPSVKALTDGDLREASEALRRRVREAADLNAELDRVLPRAFALVREAARRTLSQRHFDVQLMGGIVLHEGKIAEMLTGEGKTLAATLPAYLNALPGEGVHIVTVNDYLAKRDTVWMGQIYHALGLTVSCLVHDEAYRYDPAFAPPELDRARDTTGVFKIEEKFLRPISRGEAYRADVTYGTNHEFGFDYLRDNLALRLADRVQARLGEGDRPSERILPYAIIDEVDSILIDEARTPLIIAAPDEASSEYYKTFARVVKRLTAGEDYAVDEKLRAAHLTDQGVGKVEKMLNIPNLFAPETARLVHYLQECLKAKALFHKDKHYIVENGEIIIIDEFTGRKMYGRRYSGGLHQGIEATEQEEGENVKVQQESRTYAQITIQNYFRLYRKIAGMTGTAVTSAEEFHKVYGLDVVSIPPNVPMIRADHADAIYRTKEAKYRAVVEEVRDARERGQPVLLGTASITQNETVSAHLASAGIPHEVLNAKQHEREGAIIAQAGKPGAVTVATNMAGRGVDIILGGNPPSPEEAAKVREAGGLYVVGTERHEARRIDNQLRGRSGRQGDAGASRFFLSLEDDLLRIFGGDRLKRFMETVDFPEDVPIESGMVTKAVNEAQRKVEGANFDIRKHLLDFDDVLNKQRSALYRRREAILKAGEARLPDGHGSAVRPMLMEILESYAGRVEVHLRASPDEKTEATITELERKLEKVPETIEPERSAMIGQHLVRLLDALWVDHLENLEGLRDTVNLRAYGQHEPLVEYRREAHGLYSEMGAHFESLVWNTVFPLLEIDLNTIKAAAAPRPSPPPEAKHIGRNDPCWCGSGKKFKKCHGR